VRPAFPRVPRPLGVKGPEHRSGPFLVGPSVFTDAWALDLRPMSQVEDRLAAAGVALPQPNAPVANYVPFVRVGELVHISGQVSLDASGGVRGVVGEDVDLETAQKAARLCGLSLLAQMRAACEDDLDRVARVVKLNGF